MYPDLVNKEKCVLYREGVMREIEKRGGGMEKEGEEERETEREFFSTWSQMYKYHVYAKFPGILLCNEK